MGRHHLDSARSRSLGTGHQQPGLIAYEDDRNPKNDIYLITPESYSGRSTPGRICPITSGTPKPWPTKPARGTTCSPPETSYGGLNPQGQVDVAAYFDAKAPPLYAGNSPALGTDYLGSEAGYIISADQTGHLFGTEAGTLYQADVLQVEWTLLLTPIIIKASTPSRLPLIPQRITCPPLITRGRGVVRLGRGQLRDLPVQRRHHPAPDHRRRRHDNSIPWINNTGQVVWSGWDGSSL